MRGEGKQVSTPEGQVYVGSSSLSFSLILAQYQSSVLQWGLLSPLRTDLGKLKSSLPREKEREEERGRETTYQLRLCGEQLRCDPHADVFPIFQRVHHSFLMRREGEAGGGGVSEGSEVNRRGW